MRNLILILLFIGFASSAKTYYVVFRSGYVISAKDTAYLDSIAGGNLPMGDTVKLFGYVKDSLYVNYKWVVMDSVRFNSFIHADVVYTITPNYQ